MYARKWSLIQCQEMVSDSIKFQLEMTTGYVALQQALNKNSRTTVFESFYMIIIIQCDHFESLNEFYMIIIIQWDHFESLNEFYMIIII